MSTVRVALRCSASAAPRRAGEGLLFRLIRATPSLVAPNLTQRHDETNDTQQEHATKPHGNVNPHGTFSSRATAPFAALRAGFSARIAQRVAPESPPSRGRSTPGLSPGCAVARGSPHSP